MQNSLNGYLKEKKTYELNAYVWGSEINIQLITLHITLRYDNNIYAGKERCFHSFYS